jgi:hypothetical protein
MANWTLPNGGSLLGHDIVWETRVRYVTPPYFWFAIWTAGNIWYRGAEHDLVESFGYDNGGGFTNFDGRYWHTAAVTGSDVTSYNASWQAAMASRGITSYDATQWHIWTWVYKADNTYAMYVDGIEVQNGSGPYSWTVGAIPGGRPINMYFLYDGGWGHTQIGSVNRPLPEGDLAGTFYEWDYSRVYLKAPTAVPAAPANLRNVRDNASTMLLWDLTPNASSFNVYRSTTPGGQGSTPIATGITALAYTDTGLTNGTTYYYTVAAVNSAGVSTQSNETSTVPVTVYIVDDAAATYAGTWSTTTQIPGYYGSNYHTANNLATNVASATFTPNLPTTGSYEVFTRHPADTNRASNTPVDIVHAGGTTTVSVNQRLNYNTWVSLGTYTFNAGTAGNVTIRNGGANRGVLADAVKWVPVGTGGGSGPTAPSSLTATTISSTQVNLAWTDNATDETGFRIERKTGAGSFGLLTNKAANSTSHNDTTVAAGTSYTYRVRAENGSGNSAWSNEASAGTSSGSGPVLLHKYDEASGTSATDSSLNGNTGTLVNGPTRTTGQSGGALSFDGSNDAVTVPASGTLNNLSAVTISAWMRPNSSGENSFGRIIQKTNGFMLYLSSGNQVVFQVPYSTTDVKRQTSNNVVSYGVWTHVVVTWDGSATGSNIHIYLNGTEVASYLATTNGVGTRVDDSAGALNIGNNATQDRTFNGLLDEVSIYNRVLSPAEVAALTAGNGPVLFHKYDEASGTSATDSSLNGNTGTLVNSPTRTTSGQSGGALSFDGSNDAVTVPASATLNNLSAMTISAWMRPNNSGENSFGRIIQKTNGFMLYLSSGNQVVFQVPYSTTDVKRQTSNNVVSYGTWTHVVVTWDGSATGSNIHIYLNGTEVASYLATANGVGTRVDDSSGALNIGNNGTQDRTFNGLLDEVSIYNRVLSPAEVAALP